MPMKHWTIPALAFLAAVSASPDPMAQDKMSPARLIGSWQGDDGKSYNIEIKDGKLWLKAPVDLDYRKSSIFAFQNDFTKGLHKGKDEKLINDKTPLRFPNTGVALEYKPGSKKDFGVSIPDDIRELLLKKSDVIYHAKIDWPHTYDHPSVTAGSFGKLETVYEKQFDDEKIRVSFRTPQVTMTRFEPQKYISHRIVPDGTVTLTRSKTCGPDLTKKVVALVHHLYTMQQYASFTDRQARCINLFNPLTALSAWDINLFSPGPAVSYRYRNRTAFQCARPREPCGRSAMFFGQCVNIQVLNYVQWGAMLSACRSKDTGRLASDLRNAGSKDRYRQVLFTKWGEELVDRLRAEADDDAGKADAIDPRKVMGMAQSAYNRVFHEQISSADADRWRRRPEAQCTAKCELTQGQERAIIETPLSYRWVGGRNDEIRPTHNWGVKKAGKFPR